ncbi:Metallophosphoesterase [uncultured Paludibacter sp.]|nr:Metallophosphoesterase [uncultured Paludibacter sp.]
MKTKNIILILCLSLISISVFAGKTTKIVILHTNDTHSQVEPNKADMGGYVRRLGEINLIRNQEKNVLLFDAGDFSQGTPYFNFYNGRVEIQAMNMMHYDAATLGNHEFDNGMDTLAMVMKLAKFPFVNANYDGSNTVLKNLYKPYIIVKKDGVKIGIFGIGVKPEGLIFKKNYDGLIFENPVNKAIETSNYLRNTEKCDLVICLSHLGVEPSYGNFTDYDVAKASTNIDVIIGGHSHSILENNTENNATGKPVIIAQMGKSGLYLGRIDLTFEKK